MNQKQETLPVVERGCGDCSWKLLSALMCPVMRVDYFDCTELPPSPSQVYPERHQVGVEGGSRLEGYCLFSPTKHLANKKKWG